MSAVLTEASIVTCSHPVVPIPVGISLTGSAVLTVAGAGVLTKTDVDGKPILPAVCITTPAEAKCKSVASVTGGMVPVLTVNGQPVLAEQGLMGTTNAGGTLKATAVQVFLTAG